MVNEDAHGSTERGNLVPQIRQISDLVRREWESVEDLRREHGEWHGLLSQYEMAYVCYGAISDQACRNDFMRFHQGGHDDRMSLVCFGGQLQSCSLGGL